jgi:hypothetical protein
MVLASARLRGIHPLLLFKMADIQGGNASQTRSGLWRKHFDDESWRGSSYSSRPSVCLISRYDVTRNLIPRASDPREGT